MGRGSWLGARPRVAAVAVAPAVAAIALAGCASSSTAPAAPAPTADAGLVSGDPAAGDPIAGDPGAGDPGAGDPGAEGTLVDPMTVAACPRWDSAPDYPDGPLPPDPVSIRICPGDAPVAGPPQWRAAVDAPVDALTTGIPALVEALDASPPWEGLGPGEYCSQEGRPRVHYVVGYADGSTRSVTTGYGDCGLLELSEPGDEAGAGAADGVVARADGSAFAAAVSDALVAQREALRPPPGDRPAPRCVPNARPVTPMPVADLDLAVAAVCVSTHRGWRRAVVPPAQVADLSAALAADLSDGDGEGCTSAYVGKVVGWSTWADPVEVQLRDGCRALSAASSPANETVAPPPALLDDLLALPLGPPVPQR